MAKSLANVYTITGLTNLVVGGTIMTATAVAGAALPQGYAQAAFGSSSIFGKLTDQNRRDTERVIKTFRKQLEKNWSSWSDMPHVRDDGQRASILKSFDDVIPKIRLDSAEMVDERLDPDRMADLMLRKAETAMPNAFGAHVTRDTDVALARRFLWDISRQAFAHLAQNDDFINEIVPALWRDLLGQVERIETAVTTSAQAQAEKLARIEALLLEAVADGPKIDQAHQSGITDDALIALARRVAADVSTVDQAMVELERSVDLAIHVQSEAAQAGAPAAVLQAADQSAQGAYAAAASTIEEALAEAEAAHRTQMEALLQAGAEQDLLNRDPVSAAGKLFRLHDLKAGGAAPFDDLSQLWLSWFATGRDSGALLDLAVAETLADQLANRAVTPIEKGTALNYLGIIHHTRGEREAGLKRLTLAMAAFEEALIYWTRDSAPDHWAKAQMNLANSTHALAQRDRGNDRIGRAIDAYEAALSVRTQEADPQAWAATQMNLATALRTLADRHDEAALQASLSAVEAALTVRTQDASPPLWALTILNRALSQADLAKLKDDPALLDGVLADMDAALNVWTAETAAYYRATTLMHKGSVLRHRSRLTGDPALLDASRASLAEAMALFAQDSTPVDRLTAEGQDALTELLMASVLGEPDKLPAARARLDQICEDLAEAGHMGNAQLLEQEAQAMAS